MTDQTLTKTPKTLSFRKLPPEKKEKLLRLQNSKDENVFFFPAKLSIYYWLAAAAGILWVIYLWFSSQNILWEPWVFWLNAGLTIIAVPALIFSAAKIIGFLLGKKKDGFVFTKDEFIRVKGDRLQVWSLQQLESLRVDEDLNQLEVWSGDHEERFGYREYARAKRLENLFDGWKPEARPDFAAGLADSGFAYSPAGKTVFMAGLAAFSLLLAAGLVWTAQAANVRYDDDVVWSLAERAGTIEELEGYKVRYPQGRHLAEANQRVSALLSRIKEDYAGLPKDKADPAAVETLTAVLDEILKNAARKIYVRVGEKRELDDQVIEDLEKANGVQLEPYEVTVPAYNEDNRKEKVKNDLNLAFRDVVKEGAVELVGTEQPPENAPLIEVNYLIKPAKLIYIDNFVLGGKRTIGYYPGIEFNFDVLMRAGSGGKEYRNTYTVVPAKIDPTSFHKDDMGNYTFDKNLFRVASEEFSRDLGRSFGFTP
ncbi:MAG: hypothetical protein R2747_16865 [Pyrinomonadaceae bacterium]